MNTPQETGEGKTVLNRIPAAQELTPPSTDRNRRMTYICEFALKKTITLYINLKMNTKQKKRQTV